MRPENKFTRILILAIYLAFIGYKTMDIVKAYRQADQFRLYWSIAMVAILSVVFVVLAIRYFKKPSDTSKFR